MYFVHIQAKESLFWHNFHMEQAHIIQCQQRQA
jgi:hypothetical protein